MRKSYIRFLCIFFIFIPYSALAQSVYVPVNQKVYQYIERFEAKGVLKNALTGIKPFTRMELASFIHSIRVKYSQGMQLSSVDIDLLKFYEEEFSEEIERIDTSARITEPAAPDWLKGIKQKLPGFIYQNGRNLLKVAGENYSIFADIIARQDNNITDADSVDSIDRVYRYTTGIQIRGNLGDHVAFFVDARNTKEWGSRDYPIKRDLTAPGLGLIQNFGAYQFHDETIAYVIFKASLFEFEIGKNLNRWGPGLRGSLLLSDNATSYDMVKIRTQFWRLKFAYLFGNLAQYPRILEQEFDGNSGKKRNYAQKYIAAHRLEINIFNGVNIGLHEAVIYGQRSIELAYLNPIMFLRSAEHYLGDQDNALMGADISVNVVNDWKWYGEFLMDDIFIKRLGTKWYGNKFAYLTGLLWEDPIGISNASVRVEYTRVKPFVYTHRFPVNVYTHYGTALGHSLPPNSEEWFFAAKHYLTRKLYYTAEFRYFRHGVNTPERNVGGDIFEPLPNPGDEYIGFLEGEIQKMTGLRLHISYELLRQLFITADMDFVSGSNFTIKGVPGLDFSSRRFFIAVGLNY